MNSTIICNFKAFLQEQNYSECTIAGYIRAVKDLIDPPEEDGISAMIDYIDEALSVKRERLSKSSFANTRAALNRFFLWITGTELKTAIKQEHILNDENPLIHQYRDYCMSFLHLTPAVTNAASREVGLFLSYITVSSADLEWSTITADDVVRFLSEDRSELRISSLGVTATAIRRFFRFLQHQGVGIHSSILVLPLSIPDWSKGGSLPKVLSEQDFDKLVNYEFPDTPSGARDKAVLLCFLELGLRCSEVAKLMLSDIKWSSGSVVIRKTKTHYERELPLSKKLGEALENYVMHYRPDNGPQVFFQSTKCGCNPATTETIRSIIRRIFAKVGIDGWWIGTHTIRRSVGSRLHNAGNGLKAVSDLLGHNSINTSKAYVRVDVKSLESIADTWPEKEAL